MVNPLSQELSSSQVLTYYGVHHHLEHNLYIAGVCGCGEVRIQDAATVTLQLVHEHVLDEEGSTVYIILWA